MKANELTLYNLYYSLSYRIEESLTMPLSIKNPETEKLAREVSKETGESMTAAITNALRERLQRLRGRRQAQTLAQNVDDILRRVDALPTLDERSSDEIIGYDSAGLPR
jgi:antitoxin VapB